MNIINVIWRGHVNDQLSIINEGNKMKMINLRFLPFWPDNSLLFPDICQRVMYKKFKINKLKNEKTTITEQFAGKGIFWKLSGGIR